MVLIVFVTFELVLLLTPIFPHTSVRVSNLNTMVYGIVPLFSLSVYYLLILKNKNVHTVIILTVCWTLSLLGAYFSPLIFHPNIAITHNEVYGMDWLVQSKENDIPITDPLGYIWYRYSLLREGLVKTNENRLLMKYTFSNKYPDHFGYDMRDYFNFPNRYVVVTTYDELLYQKVPGFKKVGRFTKEDFIKLRLDIKVFKIYDSLDIDIYRS